MKDLDFISFMLSSNICDYLYTNITSIYDEKKKDKQGRKLSEVSSNLAYEIYKETKTWEDNFKERENLFCAALLLTANIEDILDLRGIKNTANEEVAKIIKDYRMRRKTDEVELLRMVQQKIKSK